MDATHTIQVSRGTGKNKIWATTATLPKPQTDAEWSDFWAKRIKKGNVNDLAFRQVVVALQNPARNVYEKAYAEALPTLAPGDVASDDQKIAAAAAAQAAVQAYVDGYQYGERGPAAAPKAKVVKTADAEATAKKHGFKNLDAFKAAMAELGMKVED